MRKIKLQRLLAALLVLLMAFSMIAAGEVPSVLEEDEVLASDTQSREPAAAEDADAEAPADAESAEPAEETEAQDADAAKGETLSDAEGTVTEYVPTLPNLTRVGPIQKSAPAVAKKALKAPGLKAVPSPSPSPVVLNKTAELSADGKNVEITLENYVTGASIISEESVPVDIVLVLDLSRSMIDFDLGDDTRLAALKAAANSFLDKVSESNDEHQVAIVTFSSNATTVQGLTKPADMTSSDGHYAVVDGLNAAAGNGTNPQSGLNAANSILSGRGTTTRPAVVVLFSDGAPDGLRAPGQNYEFTSGWNYANNAIASAAELKQIPSTTIYSVVIYDGATGNPDATSTAIDTFLNAVSSNYPDAQKDPALKSYDTSYLGEKGNIGEGKSYYLVVDDPEGLNDVFQQIASEAGGASTELKEETTVKDIVTPYFSVPADASGVTVTTRDFTGYDDAGKATWTNEQAFAGTKTFTNGKLSVSGFNYSENWVGYTTNADSSQTPKGKELVVKFTVPVKPLYLGGSVTQTNGEDSGLYEKDSDTDPFLPYTMPHVAIDMKPVEPTMKDKHIHLTQDAGVLDNLFTESTALTVGGDQQTTFGTLFDGVNNANAIVTFDLKDEDGNVLGTYTVPAGATGGSWSWTDGKPALTGDHYTLSSTVTDTADASKKAQVDVAMNIYVYMPEMTFEDQTKYYGEEITFDEPDIVWKNKDMGVAGEQMDTTEPTVVIGQNRDGKTATADSKEYVTVAEDFPVAVTFTVDGKDVTDLFFEKGKISRTCDADESHTDISKDENRFVVHVKTTSITVTKVVDGLFANKARDYDFEVTFEHPAITLDDASFSLKHNENHAISGLPVGATVTVTETNVPDNYTVTYAWTDDDAELGTTNTYTTTKDHEQVNVTVQNVLESIPITGVFAGTGPAMVAVLVALLFLGGLIAVRVEKKRYRGRT